MSIPDDLHLGLDFAQRHAQERRKGAEELIQLLRERASHESFYAQGLERIGTHPYAVASSGALAKAVKALKEHCVVRAAQAKRLSETILTDLVDPLKDLLKSQVIANKTQENLLFRSLKDLRCCKDQVVTARSDYEQQFKAIEDLVVQIESAGSPVEKKKMLSLQTEDWNWSMEKATKAYREAVKKYNGCLVEHQDELSTALNSFNMQEEERLRQASSALTALLSLDLQLLQSAHCDLTARLEVPSK